MLTFRYNFSIFNVLNEVLDFTAGCPCIFFVLSKALVVFILSKPFWVKVCLRFFRNFEKRIYSGILELSVAVYLFVPPDLLM